MYMAKKVRVNITVDDELLKKAKKKLDLFGGKLSTLFNVYLADFVKSIEEPLNRENKSLKEKLRELEERLRKLEKD